MKRKNDPELFDLLQQEAKLTQRWYARISGEVKWMPGEREQIDRLTDEFFDKFHRVLKDERPWGGIVKYTVKSKF